MKLIIRVVAAFFLFASAPIFAQSSSDTEAGKLKNFCEQELTITGHDFFPRMKTGAIAIRKGVCESKSTDLGVLQALLLELLYSSRAELENIDSVKTLGFDELYKSVALYSSRTKGVPKLMFDYLGDGVKIFLGDEMFEVDDVTKCNAEVEAIALNTDCRKYVGDFVYIFNYAQETLAGPLVQGVANHLAQLEREWDEYFENARSQTLLEMAINGYFFRKRNEQYRFLPPPDRQWIVLHPALVLEHVSDAPDGSETQEALIIEILGLNWWQQDKWYLPSGGSVISLYSDRADVESWGYGIGLHFNNDFTLGYSDHDGDGGVFFSVDLWKAFQSKKTMLEKYRGMIGQR